jgi:hypothetical protein
MISIFTTGWYMCLLSAIMFTVFKIVLLWHVLVTVGLSEVCNPLAITALPRIFVLTDISNEPDDQESLVRLLVHADLYNVTGLVAVTSYWLNSTTYPEDISYVVSNYSLVRDNLQAQTQGTFPTSEYLDSVTFSGPKSYGLAALDEDLADGTQHLISKVDSSNQPLYIQVWGGVNTLAQALDSVSRTRNQSQIDIFISKLRVYTISDQDNSGFWIRRQFPSIHYISSLHAWNFYGDATWVGISGEIYYPFDQGGPNTSLVTKEWLAEHIQIGPLGKASYLTPAFIMEGDTPSLLFSMQNGLNVPENPEYGSWGGRYALADVSRVSGNHYSDVVDYVTLGNNTFASNKATVWRWREAFQSEFAARMQWTLTSDKSAVQHPPIVMVNGSCGFEPIILQVDPDQPVVLDASDTYTTDNTTLTYDWFHYREPSLSQTNLLEVPEIPINCLDQECNRVSLQTPNVTIACASSQALHPNPDAITCKDFHVVLTVRNDRELGMTRYKRVILDVQKPANLTQSMKYM